MKFEVKQDLDKVIKIAQPLMSAAIILVLLSFTYGQKTFKSITEVDIKKTFYAKTKQSYLLRTTYGDLTGDKGEQAVVLIRSERKRSRPIDEISVYALRNGKPVKLSAFFAGQAGDYVLSIESLKSNFKIEEKIFVLDLAVLREGEYVPTQYFTIKYRWNGIQMQERERSCPKLLPEHMREVG
jgi:hypothetical protein